MSTLTLHTGKHFGSPSSGPIGYILAKWQEYRLMRTIEAVPYEVMKDVGFPAAERANEK